jgi:cell division protease FtsH
MAYAMVVDYGMSERIGSVSFNLSGAAADGPLFQKPYSDETARIIDEEVKRIIEEVRARARELLLEQREKLEQMAQSLLEKEVLGSQELLAILGPRPFGGEYVDAEADRKASEQKNVDVTGDGAAASEDPSIAGTEEESDTSE